MILTLIGMSNSGKSYWAKKLETIGFKRFSCDDYIEDKLGNELKKLGYSGIHDVSKWLGQPYEKRYAQNSQIYLKYEIESLQKFLKIINDKLSESDIVIDTTGSFIYTGDEIIRNYRKYTKIIYFDTPESLQEKMYQSYLKNPKPVIWGDTYYKLDSETDLNALKRCYPDFLELRTEKYNEIAHMKLDYFLIRKHGFTIDDFIRLIHIGLYA